MESMMTYRLKVGDEIQYTESADGIETKYVRGKVVEVIEGYWLVNVDTGESGPAVRFVIRDRCGTLHETQSMRAEVTGTDNNESPDSEKAGKDEN